MQETIEQTAVALAFRATHLTLSTMGKLFQNYVQKNEAKNREERMKDNLTTWNRKTTNQNGQTRFTRETDASKDTYKQSTPSPFPYPKENCFPLTVQEIEERGGVGSVWKTQHPDIPLLEECAKRHQLVYLVKKLEGDDQYLLYMRGPDAKALGDFLEDFIREAKDLNEIPSLLEYKDSFKEILRNKEKEILHTLPSQDISR